MSEAKIPMTKKHIHEYKAKYYKKNKKKMAEYHAEYYKKHKKKVVKDE